MVLQYEDKATKNWTKTCLSVSILKLDQVGSQSLPSKSKGRAKDDSDEAGIRACQACMDCLERYIISYNINNYRQLKNRNLFEMVTLLKWSLFSHFFTIYTVSGRHVSNTDTFKCQSDEWCLEWGLEWCLKTKHCPWTDNALSSWHVQKPLEIIPIKLCSLIIYSCIHLPVSLMFTLKPHSPAILYMYTAPSCFRGSAASLGHTTLIFFWCMCLHLSVVSHLETDRMPFCCRQQWSGLDNRSWL